MYNTTHKIRQIIHLFNEKYWLQNAGVDTELLLIHIQAMCRIRAENPAYWEGVELDFQRAYALMEEIQSAVESEDFVQVYDIFNFELWQIVRRILEVLFSKNAELLRDYFVKENRAALQERFPEMLKQIDRLDEKSPCEYVRPYGLRGRVIYRKEGNMELDLYSAYNMSGLKRLKGVDYGKYSRIYLWGCNGGTEINEITATSHFEHMELEVFVTDLYELKRILSNTYRRGMLLNPRINWNFNVREEDLIKGFDMQKKEVSYIYVCDSAKELSLLKEFICTNTLSSNIGD